MVVNASSSFVLVGTSRQFGDWGQKDASCCAPFTSCLCLVGSLSASFSLFRDVCSSHQRAVRLHTAVASAQITDVLKIIYSVHTAPLNTWAINPLAADKKNQEPRQNEQHLFFTICLTAPLCQKSVQNTQIWAVILLLNWKHSKPSVFSPLWDQLVATLYLPSSKYLQVFAMHQF